MKKWNTPELTELSISKTEDGLINVGWEGPFNILFADRSCDYDKREPERKDEKPSTPNTDDCSGM